MNIATEQKTALKAIKLPTKTTINLAKRESRKKDALTLVTGIVLIVLLAGAVAKFAVLDQLARQQAAESAYNQVHTQYEAMRQAVEDYPKVEEKYRTYSRSWMTAGDQNGLAEVDRLDVLDLVEKRLMPYGQINSISLRASVMVVSMSGMNLRDISSMVEQLRDDPIVESAALNLASTEQDTTDALMDFTLTVSLQQAEEAAE